MHRGRGRGKESQAGSKLSAEPRVGLNLTTLKPSQTLIPLSHPDAPIYDFLNGDGVYVFTCKRVGGMEGLGVKRKVRITWSRSTWKNLHRFFLIYLFPSPSSD